MRRVDALPHPARARALEVVKLEVDLVLLDVHLCADDRTRKHKFTVKVNDPGYLGVCRLNVLLVQKGHFT